MFRRTRGHRLATHCGVSLTNIKPSIRRFEIPIRIVLTDSSAHKRFQERILYFRWEDHVRTEEVLERARKKLLFDKIKLIWRWKMIGYILGKAATVIRCQRARDEEEDRKLHQGGQWGKKERSRLGLLGRDVSGSRWHRDMFCFFLWWLGSESVNSTLLLKSHPSTNETGFIRCCWGW